MRHTLIFTIFLCSCAGDFNPDLGTTSTGMDTSDGTGDGTTGDETDSTGEETDGSTGTMTDSSSDTGTTGVPEGCGDGEAQGDEECDGLDLRGKECTGFVAPTNGNFHGGALACNDDCTYDTSSCTYCGDGTKNGPAEQCDGDDLGGDTCELEGYDGGELTCAINCVPDFKDCANCEGDPAGPYGKPNVGCQGGMGMSYGGKYYSICQYKTGCQNNADCFVDDLAICANQPVCDDTGGAAWCKILCTDDEDCPTPMVCHDTGGYGQMCMWVD